ncbi:hypothetical protein Godav_027669 [Gossypium davidsonii]|uniref:Uncharacterized protein n=2 Tax=Gossypium TaxID=3633 RepID=A0A7J8RYA5_GOSDV|nr:hypothetical protein [Gossypium davidsonii]MBA0653664.1 hypothetical protein [Gossypium klotzschianum]
MAIQDEISPEMKNLANFFKWFYPLEQWADMIMFEFLKNTRVQWILIVFYKPQYFMQNGPATQLGAFPSAWIHKTYFSEDVERDPPTPYQEQLKEALKEYHSNIPDPKEWSQEYSMYYSQATQDTPTWKDVVEDISKWKGVCEMTPPNDLEQRIEHLELKCYKAREEKKRKVEE